MSLNTLPRASDGKPPRSETSVRLKIGKGDDL